MSLKEEFVSTFEGLAFGSYNYTYLVIAVKLPNGAIELITNTSNIPEKVEYYKNAYDHDFKLKSNNYIQVVDFMIV